MTKEIIKIEDYQQLTAKDYQNILINMNTAVFPSSLVLFEKS